MTRAHMKGDIVKKVLPLLDDLQRALQNRPVDELWANGIELIVRKFQTTLESEGVKRIEAEDTEFDPNFHEAISHEPNDEVESGHVIAVVQNGYMLGERVIRPALVRVAQ
jgi:molecular chaperone GrpE